jgi:hypothetical protein
VLRPLSPSVRDSLEMATAAYQKHLDVAEEYLAGRGISRAIAESHRLGVVVAPLPGHERMVGRLAIPYLGRGSVVSGLRFRSLDNGDPKYLGLPGVELRLFNVRGLHEAGDTIHITEGELDAISLTACDLHAVGVPGVTWPEEEAPPPDSSPASPESSSGETETTRARVRPEASQRDRDGDRRAHARRHGCQLLARAGRPRCHSGHGVIVGSG